MTNFDAGAFYVAMEAAVAEKGKNYIYPNDLKGRDRFGTQSCLYFDPSNPTTPRCIIGNALSRMGYTLADITRIAEEAARDASIPVGQDVSAYALLEKLGAPYNVANGARIAQAHQDDGGTWGVALEKFKLAL